MKDCDLYDNGRCIKYDARQKCKNEVSDATWFKDEFGRCSVGEVCRNSSIYGNRYFKITDDDINALKRGDVLHYVDEYGVFILYEGDKDQIMKNDIENYEAMAFLANETRNLEKRKWREKVDILAVLLGSEMGQKVADLRKDKFPDELIYETVMDLMRAIVQEQK